MRSDGLFGHAVFIGDRFDDRLKIGFVVDMNPKLRGHFIQLKVATVVVH